MVIVSFLLTISLIIWLVGIFWHKTALANSALGAFGYAFGLLVIAYVLAQKYSFVREALLEAFAIFCVAMAFAFVKRGVEFIGKKFKIEEEEGSIPKHDKQ